MRIAFFGVAHHHTAFYLQPVLAMPEHTVVAVSDPDSEVARIEAQAIGCGWSADYHDLVERYRPDFVFALGRHCDMADEAHFLIDEGIPFAMEKPMGTSYQEVAAVAVAAERKGAFVAPAFVMRYNALSKLMREELADDQFEYVLFRWFSGRTERYVNPRLSWLLDPAQAGGGCLIHLGVHHLDWFRWLCGGAEVRMRSAVTSNAAEHRAVEDYSLLSVEANGVLGTLETGYLRPPNGTPFPFDMHYVIRTNRHHLVVRDPQTTEITDLRTRATRIVSGGTTNAGPCSAEFCQDVLSRAAAGRLPEVDAHDMAEAMRLVEDGYRLAGPLPAHERAVA